MAQLLWYVFLEGGSKMKLSNVSETGRNGSMPSSRLSGSFPETDEISWSTIWVTKCPGCQRSAKSTFFTLTLGDFWHFEWKILK